MIIQKVETTKAPKAVGPYSQAVIADATTSQLLFVSGQLPIDPLTGKLMQDTFEQATIQVLNNIEAILVQAQTSFERVVRVDIFLKDLNDFQKVNQEYTKRFTGSSLPARQTIQAARLPLDALIEISCIALI